MANQAIINPTSDQKAIRNVERIKTLRDAIARAKTAERVASLQAELDRRMAEVASLKAALAEIDG